MNRFAKQGIGLFARADEDGNQLRIGWRHFASDDDKELARIIAEETERQRERVRKAHPDERPSGPSPEQSSQENALDAPIANAALYSFADSQPWELLLTFENCLIRCSKRSSKAQALIVNLARQISRPEHSWMLFWFDQYLTFVQRYQRSESEAAVRTRMLASELEKQRDAARATAKDVMTELAKKGAKARHAENHGMRDEVFAWLDINRASYKSMEKTAEAIRDAKLVPVGYRAIRDWVSEWHKLHSAGRA